MDKLLALDSCRPTQGLNQVEGGTENPLNAYEWKKALCCHPDGQFVQYVINGKDSEWASIVNISAVQLLPTSIQISHRSPS